MAYQRIVSIKKIELITTVPRVFNMEDRRGERRVLQIPRTGGQRFGAHVCALLNGDYWSPFKKRPRKKWMSYLASISQPGSGETKPLVPMKGWGERERARTGESEIKRMIERERGREEKSQSAKSEPTNQRGLFA